MQKLKFIVLQNETKDDHLPWVRACDNYLDRVECVEVDLMRSDWLERIREVNPDALLVKPGGINENFKRVYDERVYILERVLGYRVFPSAEEVFIYENKRFLASWLEANKIPHPVTKIFYKQDEAISFINHVPFPFVAKTNIGASGSGVKILKTAQEAKDYVKDTFSGKGAAQRMGPNLEKGGLLKRGFYYILHPRKIAKKLAVYNFRRQSKQTGFVIFQEFIEHEFEWRVVRIGDSFFAHKKLKMGEKASGTLLKNYDNPPLTLFDFVKEITDRFGLYSQAIDIFESQEGKYLVNEMQCIFGQSDPYQMLVDGEPGRYIHKDNQWVFEEGDFARNACYNLRLEHLIDTLRREVHKKQFS